MAWVENINKYIVKKSRHLRNTLIIKYDERASISSLANKENKDQIKIM